MHQFANTLWSHADNGCGILADTAPSHALSAIPESPPCTEGWALTDAELRGHYQWLQTLAASLQRPAGGNLSLCLCGFRPQLGFSFWSHLYRQFDQMSLTNTGRHGCPLPSASCLGAELRRKGQGRAAQLWPPVPGLEVPAHQSRCPTAQGQNALVCFDFVFKMVSDFFPLSNDAGCQQVSRSNPSLHY